MSSELWAQIRAAMATLNPARSMSKVLGIKAIRIRDNGLDRVQTQDAWICRWNEMRRGSQINGAKARQA